eukprot:scaffold93556_cov69-Phaeocystis_antarctica.AAC.1
MRKGQMTSLPRTKTPQKTKEVLQYLVVPDIIIWDAGCMPLYSPSLWPNLCAPYPEWSGKPGRRVEKALCQPGGAQEEGEHAGDRVGKGDGDQLRERLEHEEVARVLQHEGYEVVPRPAAHGEDQNVDGEAEDQ